MFLTYEKLECRIKELKKYRYRDVKTADHILVKEDTQKKTNPKPPTSFDGWDTMLLGDFWKGRDKYLWLHLEIEIPAQWKGRRAVGVFDFGLTGEGNNSGFESLLYIDEKPYQGVDINHREVFFKEEMYGRKVNLTFRLWSGLEGGGKPKELLHQLKKAQLGWLDEETDDLYYTADMILKTIAQLNQNDPIRHNLQTDLDRAFCCIDWSEPGSDLFYETVKQADRLLNEKIDAKGKHSDINVYAVGHTHIDTAWLWRLKHTREKCSRSFSTVLRLMEMFPEYIFLQTQPQLYEYVKEDFPELYEEIKERIKQERWEVDGAMWVEADCNLTSGESLVRQILIGNRFIKQEFGKDVHYLWLPDVFGYSWALPQILKKSGIDIFMTTKISWNQYNRMPHDTFYWKGIDGSCVLTHFITTPTPDSQPGSWFYTYNGQIIPKTVQGVWDAYSDKDINQDLLISYGYGDGGGGVNRDNLERRRRIDRIEGMPNLKTSTAGAYFEKLKENVKSTDQYVNTWDGELYLEYHRGTYTSHAYNKRMNRKMELLYRKVEWFTVMKALLDSGKLEQAMQENLTKGWKLLLTNQFHDIIPGSSIFEVYEDCKKDYAKIEEIAKEVEKDFLSFAVKEEEKTYTIINTNSFAIGGVVLLPDIEAKVAYSSEKTPLMVQQTDEGLLIGLDSVPPMGCVKVTVENTVENLESSTGHIFQVEDKKILTPYYIVVYNEYGQISRLYDRRADREVIPNGQRANVLQIFEDKPLNNDAWDIDIFYQQKMKEITDLKCFEVIENGSLRLTLHFEWHYMNSAIFQDIIFYAADPRIDFVTKVDFHEKHQLLKAAFPVDIRTTYGTFDVQYGNVRRANHWNTSWDEAKFETVAHRFADLSEYGYGVSLLNDCKYGHDVKDNVLRLTLLKTATNPDHNQDQGEHFFTYSLLPHMGDFIEGHTVQKASALNQPLYAVAGCLELPFTSFLSFDKECVELDAVKKTEDGNYLAVRFHEFTGGTNRITVKTGFLWKRYCISNLMEYPIEEWKQEKEIVLTVKPYEIVTLLFEV